VLSATGQANKDSIAEAEAAAALLSMPASEDLLQQLHRQMV
jgi:hypothetical protein